MEDIKRLKKVVAILTSLEKIFYHMDEDEYDRMRKYTYSRLGIDLPLKNPAVGNEEKLQNII